MDNVVSVQERPWLFQPGNSGKPAGAKSKIAHLQIRIAEAFERNSRQASKLLDEMFQNKRDFQWLCTLAAAYEIKKADREEASSRIASILSEVRDREASKSALTENTDPSTENTAPSVTVVERSSPDPTVG